MKRRTIIRILLLVALIMFPVAIIPAINAPLLQLIGPAGTALTDYGIIAGMILIGVAILLVFYPRLALKHQLWGYRGLASGEKIYSIEECEDSCLNFLGKYYKNNGEYEMRVYGQWANSYTSDTPYVLFFASTFSVSFREKNPLKKIPENETHYVLVNRKTRECTYDPSVSTREAAFGLLNTMRDMDIPLEMKKSLERELLENVKRGYAQRLGESIAGSPPSGNQVKEEAKNEGKE